MFQIAPSLLAADLLNLKEEVSAVLKAGAELIHLDVMDNHYVPNLTFGPDFCHALRQHFPEVCLDVHLMASPVSTLIEKFAKAGASRIAIHPDACIHLDRELSQIKNLGCQAGLAINPATSLDCLTHTHQSLDFVLIMSVNPGFGGQTLLPHCLDKITAIKDRFPNLSISVDGGINIDTIQSAARAGASTFIVGAGLFSSQNYEKTIASLKQQCSSI